MQNFKISLKPFCVSAGVFIVTVVLGSSRLSAQEAQDEASVQAVRNYVEAIKDLRYEPELKQESIARLAEVTTEDFTLLAPGLGPLPFVGREAIYNARKENVDKNNATGFRMELVEVLFAKGPYVIATRNDRRMGKDGKEQNAGDNILGAYVVKDGKVLLNYNAGGGRPTPGQGDPSTANIEAVKSFMEALKDYNTPENLAKASTDDLVMWTPGLGPKPHVGRDAVFKARKESAEQNNAVSFRSEFLETVFTRGSYVITRRNDYRILKDRTERGAGSNIMGLYVVRDGKVSFFYNFNVAPTGASAGQR